MDSQRDARITTASGLDVVAGFWLMGSAYLFQTAGTQFFTNNLVFGSIVVTFALVRTFGARTQAWMSWVNAAIGLWVIFSPWGLGFDNNRDSMRNNVVTGIIIVALASWSATTTSRNWRPYLWSLFLSATGLGFYLVTWHQVHVFDLLVWLSVAVLLVSPIFYILMQKRRRV